jgi:hypothetical protein
MLAALMLAALTLAAAITLTRSLNTSLLLLNRQQAHGNQKCISTHHSHGVGPKLAVVLAFDLQAVRSTGGRMGG